MEKAHVAVVLNRSTNGLKIRVSPVRSRSLPPFLYLRQSNRLAFLFLRPESKRKISSKSSDDRDVEDESGREH